MKTKFIYVILAALLIGSQTISAQNKDNKTNKQRPTPEQMIQRQANQMVTTLMLDDATAAKFTPVYEKYLKDLSECRMMNRRERPRNNNAEATPATKPVLTDAEIEKMIENGVDFIVDSDAHSPGKVGDFSVPQTVVDRLHIPAERIANFDKNPVFRSGKK